MRFPQPAVAAALFAFAACSTYDFSKARLPDGSLDVPRLIQDIEASGRNSLDEGIWIPLIHTRVLCFEKNGPDLPKGYTLRDVKAWGPLFFAGGADAKVVDEHGKAIESGDREWAGWGVIYRDRDQYVETPHGTRHEKHERILLLFGGDHTAYAQPSKQPRE